MGNNLQLYFLKKIFFLFKYMYVCFCTNNNNNYLRYSTNKTLCVYDVERQSIKRVPKMLETSGYILSNFKIIIYF